MKMLRVMGAKKVFRSLNKCICMAGAAREMSKRSEVIKNEKKVQNQPSILKNFGSASSCAKTCPNKVKADKRDETVCKPDEAIQRTKVPKLDLTDDDIDAMFGDDFMDFSGNQLDLSEWQHCTIDNIEKISNSLKIYVRCTKSDTSSYCYLKGVWSDIELKVGLIVSLKARKCSLTNCFEIDDNDGLLVINPDILLSGTSIVGSVFCKRRAILSERFSGFDPVPIAMLLGTVIHDTFGKVLSARNYSEAFVQKCVNDFVNDRQFVFSLFGTDISLNDLKFQIKGYIPKIIQFVTDYMNDKSPFKKRNFYDFNGVIRSIEDIEENIWSPELGLKGRIDVTVKAFDRKKNKELLVPLELKTGKFTQSIEHRGQLALYMLMLDQMYGNVDTGLLLYLKDCVVQCWDITRFEMRDLIKLRNEMSHFLLNSNIDIECVNLPEPIDNLNACKRCPYLTVCATYSRHEKKLDATHTFGMLSKSVTDHLTKMDIDFFIKWSTILTIEANGFSTNKEIKDIWLLKPHEREKKGRAISNVEIVGEVVETSNNKFVHTFKKISADDSFAINKCGLELYHYVFVSSSKRCALGAGYITDIDYDHISISLERNLQKKYPELKTYHIDSCEVQNSYSFTMGCLSLLIENNVRAAHLRRLIIVKEKPEFNAHFLNGLPDFVYTILGQLNGDQQKAVLKVLQAKDYVLIKGMAGTGKTSTLAALIEILSKLNKSVIITSQTHSAIDNIGVKLAERGVHFLRLGNEKRIQPELFRFSEAKQIQDLTTLNDLEIFYNKMNVVAVTCFGTKHVLLNKKCFDYCIVDESTQVLQVVLLRTFMASKVFVLVGDPHQLPPIVRTTQAKQLGMDESLFESLDNLGATVTLCHQYRMNCEIMRLANKFTYDNQLQCANDKVANSTVSYTFRNRDDWITKLLDSSLEASFRVIDTGPIWKLSEPYMFQDSAMQTVYQKVKSSFFGDKENSKCINHFEVAIILALLKELKRCGMEMKNVGIIAPYRAQIALLEHMLQYDDLEVNTVDQFQGRDKDIIIYSCTKSGFYESKFEILNDKRRLTVAITRAKFKFIMIGDVETLQNLNPFKELFSYLRSDQVIQLSSLESFNWNYVFQ